MLKYLDVIFASHWEQHCVVIVVLMVYHNVLVGQVEGLIVLGGDDVVMKVVMRVTGGRVVDDDKVYNVGVSLYGKDYYYYYYLYNFDY